jgi:hypothetical protein
MISFDDWFYGHRLFIIHSCVRRFVHYTCTKYFFNLIYDTNSVPSSGRMLARPIKRHIILGCSTW